MVAEAVSAEPDISPVQTPLAVQTVEVESVIHVRNAAKREMDVRLMPWERTVSTAFGLEVFTRGAFDDATPERVLLMGLEHEAHIGIGQGGQPVVTRHPVGRAIALENRDDGQYATFRVAQTSRGDEVLALAADGIASGVSVEFSELPGGSVIQTISSRRTKRHNRAVLHGASTTYRPTYDEAVVLSVRTQEGVPEVSESPAPVAEPTPTPPPAVDITALGDRIGERFDEAFQAAQSRSAASDEAIGKMLERLDKMEEQARASFQIPAQKEESGHPEDFGRGDWLKLVLRSLAGETVSHQEMQARVAADLITSDNLGVVPDTYTDEIIGIVDPARPFMSSTRRLPTPRTGMSLVAPKIATRPTVGKQDAEKDELTSTTTSITTETFNAITVGGYGDISLQLLRRSDPSYLELYLDLLAEAYAIDADDRAIETLINDTDISLGGAVDPDAGAQFGSAWKNAAAVSRRLVPDTLWMSSEAVSQFIDAKSDTTNAPLYANLAANFTAGSGAGGTISGLRPVHVPSLDDEDADMVVGPSRGFAWAEDGTYTLQVDVPAKAGRDVGLVGMLWFAPLYPAAFTRYWLTS